MAYLDNLKLLLVAVIIAAHGALAYGSLVIPAVLFAMGLFFLVSGLVTPGSVSHKGP